MLYRGTRTSSNGQRQEFHKMSAKSTVDARLAEVVSDVQLPLDNLAFTVEAYLMANGPRLDTETRYLLAGIRDCAGRVAGCVRQMAHQNRVTPMPRRMHRTGLQPADPF
jgi:hypothetical protein